MIANAAALHDIGKFFIPAGHFQKWIHLVTANGRLSSCIQFGVTPFSVRASTQYFAWLPWSHSSTMRSGTGVDILINSRRTDLP